MEAMASEFGYCLAPPPQPPCSKNPDNFAVEDLLDFSHDDGASDQLATTDSLSSTPLDTSHSSDNNHLHQPHLTSPSHFSDSHFSGDLCLPYEDSAELEWLSNFVEDSFSTEDIQKLQLISGMSALKTRSDDHSEPRYYPLGPTRPDTSPSQSPTFSSEMPVPGKARSKRSRAAPGNWATCLRLLHPAQHDSTPAPAPMTAKPTSKKKGGSGSGSGSRSGMGSGPEPARAGEVRRCLHCATDKTPQWRTGPMGPKTLCNACGVRYKSGRLVPEYRPAASPTFVLTKHSNSHRKVMELRRQKELQRQQQFQQQQFHQHHQQQMIHNPNSMMFDPPNNDDYLIHQHIGPDFRQLI